MREEMKKSDTKKVREQVREALFSMQDVAYGDFHSRLMPTVERERVIGVRTPMLRKYAKEFGKTKEAICFLEDLPHFYYEENNVHGFLIEQIKDYEECINALETFLPCVDNWATCDMMSPKILQKNKPHLEKKAKEWLKSPHPYMVRYGIGVFMKYFLEEDFKPEHLEWILALHREEYYIKMMVAWYFATALAKQYAATIPYIEGHVLEEWIHKKTIQKAVESYRITKEQKEYLRRFRS